MSRGIEGGDFLCEELKTIGYCPCAVAGDSGGGVGTIIPYNGPTARAVELWLRENAGAGWIRNSLDSLGFGKGDIGVLGLITSLLAQVVDESGRLPVVELESPCYYARYCKATDQVLFGVREEKDMWLRLSLGHGGGIIDLAVGGGKIGESQLGWMVNELAGEVFRDTVRVAVDYSDGDKEHKVMEVCVLPAGAGDGCVLDCSSGFENLGDQKKYAWDRMFEDTRLCRVNLG